jgi:hypothetical protein
VGIEPTTKAWKAFVLPLNYARWIALIGPIRVTISANNVALFYLFVDLLTLTIGYHRTNVTDLDCFRSMVEVHLPRIKLASTIHAWDTLDRPHFEFKRQPPCGCLLNIPLFVVEIMLSPVSLLIRRIVRRHLWTVRGSNPQPPVCQTGALPIAPTALLTLLQKSGWPIRVCNPYRAPP